VIVGVVVVVGVVTVRGVGSVRHPVSLWSSVGSDSNPIWIVLVVVGVVGASLWVWGVGKWDCGMGVGGWVGATTLCECDRGCLCG
jgi:hypothetical protein